MKRANEGCDDPGFLDDGVDPAKRCRITQPLVPHLQTDFKRLVPHIQTVFKHSDARIFTIFPLDQEKALVHVFRANNNAIVHRTGAVLRSLGHQEKFNSFSRMDSGHYFASNLYSCSLQKIDLEGNKSPGISTYPYKPTSLCRTRTGKTLLGLLNPGTTSGFVLEIEEIGEMIRQTEVRDPAFSKCPSRIAENVNGDICVVHMNENYNLSGLTVFSSDWKARFLYSGHCDFPSFEPTGVCCDTEGNIYIADHASSAIHVLNQNGVFLQFLLTKQDGLEAPSCIAYSPAGELWIGCENGEILVVKCTDQT